MPKMTVPRLLCIQGSGCDSVSACDGRRLESRNELGGKRGDLPGNPLAGASHGVALELQLIDSESPHGSSDGRIPDLAAGVAASHFPSLCIVAAPSVGQFCRAVPASYFQRCTREPAP